MTHKRHVLFWIRLALCVAVVALVLVRGIGCAIRWESASFSGNRLTVDGVVYRPCTVTYSYSELGAAIARADGWTIAPLGEDPSRTFLEARSFMDTESYVREDYTVPLGGSVTVVYLDGGQERFTDADTCRLAAELASVNGSPAFSLRTDRIYLYSNSVHVGYEGCPVGTDYLGRIGEINGVWVFIPPLTNPQQYENGAPLETYLCYPLTAEQAEIARRLPEIRQSDGVETESYAIEP